MPVCTLTNVVLLVSLAVAHSLAYLPRSALALLQDMDSSSGLLQLMWSSPTSTHSTQHRVELPILPDILPDEASLGGLAQLSLDDHKGCRSLVTDPSFWKMYRWFLKLLTEDADTVVTMIPYISGPFSEEVLPEIQSCTLLSQLQEMARRYDRM